MEGGEGEEGALTLSSFLKSLLDVVQVPRSDIGSEMQWVSEHPRTTSVTLAKTYVRVEALIAEAVRRQRKDYKKRIRKLNTPKTTSNPVLGLKLPLKGNVPTGSQSPTEKRKQAFVVSPRGTLRHTPSNQELLAIQTLHARALYAYNDDHADRLSLQPGDVVTIIRRYKDGWCWGKSGKASGFFPESYVAVESSTSAMKGHPVAPTRSRSHRSRRLRTLRKHGKAKGSSVSPRRASDTSASAPATAPATAATASPSAARRGGTRAAGAGTGVLSDTASDTESDTDSEDAENDALLEAALGGRFDGPHVKGDGGGVDAVKPNDGDHDSDSSDDEEEEEEGDDDSEEGDSDDGEGVGGRERQDCKGGDAGASGTRQRTSSVRRKPSVPQILLVDACDDTEGPSDAAMARRRSSSTTLMKVLNSTLHSIRQEPLRRLSMSSSSDSPSLRARKKSLESLDFTGLDDRLLRKRSEAMMVASGSPSAGDGDAGGVATDGVGSNTPSANQQTTDATTTNATTTDATTDSTTATTTATANQGPDGDASSVAGPNASPSNAADEVEVVSAAEVERMAAHFKRAKQELVETEGKYLKDLLISIQLFEKPLSADETLVPAVDRGKLFGQGRAVLHVTKQLWKELSAESKKPSEEQRFGRCLVANLPYFRVYIRVCSVTSIALAAHSRLMESNPAYAAYMAKARQNVHSKGLDLESYVVKPFQRICKYPLLIRAMINNITEEHPDHADLRLAYDGICKIVEEIDRAKGVLEESMKVAAIQQAVQWQLSQAYDLATPTRRLLKEGSLWQVTGSRTTLRYVYLFNDALLVCRLRGERRIHLLLVEWDPSSPNVLLCRPDTAVTPRSAIGGATVIQTTTSPPTSPRGAARSHLLRGWDRPMSAMSSGVAQPMTRSSAPLPFSRRSPFTPGSPIADDLDEDTGALDDFLGIGGDGEAEDVFAEESPSETSGSRGVRFLVLSRDIGPLVTLQAMTVQEADEWVQEATEGGKLQVVASVPSTGDRGTKDTIDAIESMQSPNPETAQVKGAVLSWLSGGADDDAGSGDDGSAAAGAGGSRLSRRSAHTLRPRSKKSSAGESPYSTMVPSRGGGGGGSSGGGGGGGPPSPLTRTRLRQDTRTGGGSAREPRSRSRERRRDIVSLPPGRMMSLAVDDLETHMNPMHGRTLSPRALAAASKVAFHGQSTKPSDDMTIDQLLDLKPE